ncbi:MAG: hypothetical protein NTZ54_13725 [Alphaproteobacteria bacterium]|nr:hypothetical protein [Alphaproteobacteria bacterium]
MDWIFYYLSDSITALLAAAGCATIALAAILMLVSNLLEQSGE